MPRPHKAWTHAELALLKSRYPTEGSGCFPALVANGRSEHSIRQKITALGLRVADRGALMRTRSDEKKPKPLTVKQPPKPKSRELGEPTYIAGHVVPYGSTAGTAPQLTKVPDAATNLPWVSYPRNAKDCIRVADVLVDAMCDVSNTDTAVMSFLTQQVNYLRALANKLETDKAA